MKRIGVLILCCLLIFGNSMVFTEAIDLSYIQIVFDEIKDTNHSEKAIYESALKGAFYDEDSLEAFKENYKKLLTDNQLQNMTYFGITDDMVSKNIDALKTWSKEDRMQLIEYGFMENQDVSLAGIETLNRKYTVLNAVDSQPIVVIGSKEVPLTSINHRILLAEGGFLSSRRKIVRGKPNFKDTLGHWSQDTVNRMYQLEIINGKSVDRFDPEGSIRKAEVVTMLVNMVIEDPSKLMIDRMKLSDIPLNAWYREAIDLGMNLGIVKLDSEMNSNALSNPERELIIEMMMDTLIALGFEMNESLLVYSDSFEDMNEVSPSLYNKVIMAINIGIIEGNANNTLTPKRIVKRSEVVVMMERLYDYILTTLDEQESEL